MPKEDKERALYVLALFAAVYAGGLAGFGLWLMATGILASLASSSPLRRLVRNPAFLAGLAFLCIALVLGNAS